jgi:hypothetical protein
MRINPFKYLSIAILFCILNPIADLKSQTLTANDFSAPKEINDHLFSFNAGFMMEVCGASNDVLVTGAQPPLNSYYLNPACPEIINEINPSVIRFPGGTGANYYHYYGRGYGFISSEVIGSKFESLVGSDQWIPENHIVKFADLALQTGSKVIYVANLFTHFKQNGAALIDPNNAAYRYSLKENLDAISYLENRGLEVVGVELGNELYAFVEVNNTSGNRTKYLNLARVYADSIKARFPGMPVGVPIQPVGGVVDLNLNPWNKAMKFADFADAYIIHEYEKKVRNSCTNTADKEIYFDCAKQKLDEFLDLQLEVVLENYWTFYGRSKKFWLTEWNMLEPQYVANTYLHTYFLTKYWNNLIQLDKKYPGDISISNCHNLVSGGYLYPAVGMIQPNESSSLIISQPKFVQRAAYYAHTMMSPLLTSDNRFVGKTKINQLQTWVYKTASGEYDLVIINDTGEEVILSYNSVDGVLIGNPNEYAFSKFSQLSAENNYDAAGVNFYNSASENVLNELTFVKNATPENPNYLMLPGYSTSVIRVGEVDIDTSFAITNLVAHVQNCIVQINWTVENDADGLNYVIEQNNTPIDTIASFGNNTLQNYNITIQPEVNGNYNYQVKVYSNNNLNETTTVASVNVDCVEELLPEFTFLQVAESGNCQYNYTWRIDNNIPNSYFLVAITENSNVYVDTVQGSLATLYGYSFTPPTNGSYQFQVAIYENGEFLAVSDVTNVTVSCVYTPPFITDYSIANNNNCSYTLRWTVANEQSNSRYAISSNFNGSGYTEIYQTISTGNFTLKHYEYVFTPDENGEFLFKIDHFVNNLIQNTRYFSTLNVNCVPDPDPVLTQFSVSEIENCGIQIQWTTTGELPSSNYKISVGKDGLEPALAYQLQASATASTVSYSWIHYPEENGSYVYEIEHSNNGNVIANATQSATVGCIVIPTPEVTNLSVVLNGNCNYQISWNVTNESANSAYIVLAVLEGDTLTPIYSTNSNGAALNANYSFNIGPSTNGNYTVIVQQFNDGVFVSSLTVENVLVTCIIEPAAMVDFSILDNNNCTYQLNWTTSDETLSSSYIIKANLNNSSFESIGSISANQVSALANYNLPFTPLENGFYQFQVDHYIDNNFVSSTSILSQSVECIIIPSNIEDAAVTESEACSYIINWSVSNEIAGNLYEVQVSFNEGEFETLHTVESTIEGALIEYNLGFEPVENGNYQFQINQIENDAIVQSSSPIFVDVTCIQTPLPSFSLVQLTNNNCQLNFTWRMENHIPNCEFLIAITNESSTFIDTIQGSIATLYSYSYIPENNGDYEFRVAVYENDALLTISNAANITVSCVYTPPFIIDHTIIDNADCSYTLRWTVANEQTNSRYNLLSAFNGGTFSNVSTQFSTGNYAVINYEYVFTPEADGSYQFKLNHIANGVPQTTENFAPLTITCAPDPDPIMSNFAVTAQEECSVLVQWQVSGELPTGSYKVYVRRNDEPLSLINTVLSAGTAANILYEFLYTPELNGTYVFEIEQFNNGTTLLNDSETINVNCVVAPDPILVNLDISYNGNCNYVIEWDVLNETSTGNYTAFVTLEGDTLESIYYTTSIGTSDSSHYSFIYSPELNGNYTIVIQQFTEANFINAVSSEVFFVECIVTPPSVKSFTVTENANCSYSLNWVISNELLASSYDIKVNFNNLVFETIDQVIAQSEEAIVNYNYNFLPEENGHYQFQIDRLENNVFVAATSIVEKTVNCVIIPSELQSISATELTDCEFDVSWTVSNEVIGHTYQLQVAYNGGNYQTIATLESIETGSLVYYNYSFFPEENGSYVLKVVRVENGTVAESTQPLSVSVTCIEEIILPTINSFSATSNQNCSVQLNWNVSNQNAGTQIIIKERVSSNLLNTIATINGNSSQSNGSYSIAANGSGNYKYLIEVYQDGAFVSSSNLQTVNVYCPINVSLSMDVYPFFTFGDFTVNINVNQPLVGNIQIVSIFFGNIVHSRAVNLVAGSNTFNFNMDNYYVYSGLYRVIFTYSGGSDSETFIYF